MEKERNYDNDGLDPSEEYFRKKENDDDTYFPPEESEPPHYWAQRNLLTVDLKLEKSTLFYKLMDNIGKNEKLLRSSKDFQKLGEGKKRRRLLKEAQRKDGTYLGPKSKPWTPERIEQERIAEEKRRERLIEIERGSYFERPEGMSWSS